MTYSYHIGKNTSVMASNQKLYDTTLPLNVGTLHLAGLEDQC